MASDGFDLTSTVLFLIITLLIFSAISGPVVDGRQSQVERRELESVIPSMLWRSSAAWFSHLSADHAALAVLFVFEYLVPARPAQGQ